MIFRKKTDEAALERPSTQLAVAICHYMTSNYSLAREGNSRGHDHDSFVFESPFCKLVWEPNPQGFGIQFQTIEVYGEDFLHIFSKSEKNTLSAALSCAYRMHLKKQLAEEEEARQAKAAEALIQYRATEALCSHKCSEPTPEST